MSRRKKDEINLSPKHGLNPCMPICFFCGKEKGEILLMGKIDKQDSEAPRSAIVDYEPCDNCKEQMAKGITLIGTTDSSPDNRPEIGQGRYPTGRWVTVSESFARELFVPDVIDSVLKAKSCLVDDDMLINMMNKTNKPDNEES